MGVWHLSTTGFFRHETAPGVLLPLPPGEGGGEGAPAIPASFPHHNSFALGEGARNLPRKEGRGVCVGWSHVVLILVTVLLWPLITGAATQGSRPPGSKPQPSAKGAPSGGAVSSGSPLWTVRDIRHWGHP